MNEPHSPEDDAVIRRTVAALREWEAKLDAVQAAKLASARRRALAAGTQGSALAGWAGGWQGAALAAAVLISVGAGVWPHKKLPMSAPPVAVIDAPEWLAADDADSDELLDEDLALSLALSGLDEKT